MGQGHWQLCLITDELPDGNYVSNGDLWFDNTEDTMQLFLLHEESGMAARCPAHYARGRVDAGEATQQAITIQNLIEQAKLQNKVNALEGVLGDNFTFNAQQKPPTG